MLLSDIKEVVKMTVNKDEAILFLEWLEFHEDLQGWLPEDKKPFEYDLYEFYLEFLEEQEIEEPTLYIDENKELLKDFYNNVL